MRSPLGQCHCGAVRFGRSKVISRDQRRSEAGSKVIRVERLRSTLLFCPQCGIQCFTAIRRNGQQTYAVNLACIDGKGLSGIAPRVFDGASLP